MKMVLVGASGYGGYYLNLLDMFVDLKEHPLVGAVDPLIGEDTDSFRWLNERGVQVFKSLEDFYRENRADLALICSPIQFHREQSILAMRNGSAVLCEKPVAPVPEDALEMHRVHEETGMPLGVGFQWSFSPTMQALKRDILDGKLGKPKRLRTLISWKRDDHYYDPRGWKGRIQNKQGQMIMDSIAMNATAHYLHNMLFLLGDEMDASEMPRKISGCTYRARDIESYDTIFLRGDMLSGAEIIYTASHAAKRTVNPVFSYEFEKGTVTFSDATGGEVWAEFSDGTKKCYGCPQTHEETAQKILSMLKAAESKTPPPCHILTVLPHLAVCKAVHDNMPVKDFPPSMIVMETNPPGRHAVGVNEAMDEFYETGRLPHEQGLRWATEAVEVRLQTEKT